MSRKRRRATPLVTEQTQGITFTRRALVLGGLQAGVGLLLAGRMAYISIAENERSQLMAEENRVHLRLIPPRRGWIVDRNGLPIAQNRSTFRVDLLPDRIGDADQLLAQLQQLLQLKPDDVERVRTELERAAGSQPVAVAENLSYDPNAAITLRQMDAGRVAAARFSRHYPRRRRGGPSVAMSAPPIATEYLAAEKDPLLITPGFKIGKEGLEETMEAGCAASPARPASRSPPAAAWCASWKPRPTCGPAAPDHHRPWPAKLCRAAAGR
jgi:penicillin-binding protein 2